MVDAGHFSGDACDLLHDCVGTVFRSAVGQLCADDQIALVFVRQKCGRDAGQPPDRYDDKNKRKEHHGGAAARHRADQARIGPLGDTKDGVEAAIKKVALLDRDRRSQP